MLEWRQFLNLFLVPRVVRGNRKFGNDHNWPFSVLKESYSDESIFIWFSGSLRRPLKGHLQFLGWIRTSIWCSWSSKSAPGGTSRCQDRWHYAAETWIKDNEHNFLLHLSWCLVWCGLMALNEHALLDMVQFIMPLFDNSEHALLDMVQFRQQSNFLAFRNPLQLRSGV